MLRARRHFLLSCACNSLSLFLSLTSEQGAHTLFTSQREREIERESGREREIERESGREREK
jgi:hypothetical protein